MAYLMQGMNLKYHNSTLERDERDQVYVVPGNQVPPNVCASLLMGLVVLASFVGFVYFQLYEAQAVVSMLAFEP
jgi:hypothetical protein